jgi:hypothetical protein
MAKSPREVRILNASLEDDRETGQIIIRGVVDQDTLKYIDLDWYQREQGFSISHINEIVGAFYAGISLPDIEIGMRGQRVKTHGDTYSLLDKCFCMNGGQRLYAAAVAVAERPDVKIHLGAKTFLGTTEEFENDRFCKLGTTEVRISPSILLRNRKKASVAVRLMLAVSSNEEFALKSRVSWNQKKTAFELMNAYTLAQIIARLHAHKGGQLQSTKIMDLIDALDKVVARTGEDIFTQNMIRFFDAIDRCWTVRNLGRGDSRPHLSPRFLKVLAKLLSNYHDFWNDKERNEFFFPLKFIRHMKGMKVADFINNSRIVPPDALYEILRKKLQLNPIFEEDADAAE